ncbi:reverse transcriptase domain-containing protein [Tanacetum coccineum]
MSTHKHTPIVPTSAVRNTRGRSGPQRLKEPMPDEVLRELCDKNYHQLLPLIAQKMQKEKEQQDKCGKGTPTLRQRDRKNQRNHEESHYSESKTPTARTEPKRRHENRRSRSPTLVTSEEKNEVHLHDLTAATRVPTKRKSRYNQESIIIGARRPGKLADIRRVKTVREVTGSPDQEDTDQTPTKMISLSLGHVRKETLSYLAAKKTERWAILTWCYMFNSTLIENARVWFDKLPRESIDSYEDLRTAFREKYLQQTKHIKDPVEIHHIKQRDGESTEDFMERYKAKNTGCGRSAKMHEDLRIHARYNPPRADQAFIGENSEVKGRNVQGGHVFSARGSCRIQS